MATPFYEKNSFWGFLSLAGAGMLTAAGLLLPATEVARWLLILAWIVIAVPIWLAAREMRIKWLAVTVGALVWIACGYGAGRIWSLRTQSPPVTVERKPAPSPSPSVSPPSAAEVASELAKHLPLPKEVQKEHEESVSTKDSVKVKVKRSPTAPTSAAPTQNCPNGVCIGGDNSGSPTVNNYAPPQRAIDSAQMAAFQTAVSPGKGLAISVYCYSTDKEGCTYGKYFFVAFRHAGWDVGLQEGMYFATPSDSEVYLTIQNQNTPPPGFDVVMDGIRAIGLPPRVLVDSNLKPDELRLNIGRN